MTDYRLLSKTELIDKLESLEKHVTAMQSPERHDTQQALDGQQRMLTSIFASSPDLLALKDRRSVYLAVNSAFCEYLGKTEGDILGKTDFDLFPRDKAEMHRWDDARVMETGIPQIQDEAETCSVGQTWLQVVKTPVRDLVGRITGVLYSVRDVTKRKQMEAELRRHKEHLEESVRKRTAALKRVNRAYRTINGCGKILVRATDESQMLDEICQLLVSVGHYRMAWVARAKHDRGKTVQPVAQAGYEEGYLDTLDITWADTERGRGPTGRAIRTGATIIVGDIQSDPDFRLWRADALARGYASSIAIPLMVRGDIWGALNIYAPEPDAFDTEETTLLEDLANDVAHGIDALQARTERVHAQLLLERNLRDQEILTSILTIAQKSAPLTEILEKILDLVLTQSGLSIERKGCVFLIEGEPDTLVMKAQSGMPESLIEACAKVAFGTCLCGQAAETGAMVHALADDEQHTTVYEGMQPHGHYCVPIRSDEELLGVINLYLPGNGTESFEEEARLLSAVTDTIAGIILRIRAEEARTRLLDENRELSRRVLAVQEEERRYLARELHDELAQNLSAIVLYASRMSETAGNDDPEMLAGAYEVLGLTKQMVVTVRSLMERLRPSLLDQLGLIETLSDMVDKWRSRHRDIDCTFSTAGKWDDSGEDVCIALYRMVQESLTNIEKHADPSIVRIELERTDSGIRLEIGDNGQGMDINAPRSGMGLVGMRERAESLHGTFELRSRPGGGTIIRIALPVQA